MIVGEPWNVLPGAIYLGEGECDFAVWAPYHERVDVVLEEPVQAEVSMDRDEWGWFRARLDGVHPGALYRYALGGETLRPDPASLHQPRGVHGPSAVVDQTAFHWSDEEYQPAPLEEYVLYELHPGTFTPEGTYYSAAAKLDDLRALGVNAVSLMPAAQFPGSRNWGYDGAYPFAVQDSYGGPDGLKALVDAAHSREMAVVLDVVYNHLGPEGNYIREFGPYFTDRYRTPWGDALNFDGAWSDFVRNHFIQNALMWAAVYHIDGLRLDAVHAIYDFSARPFLAELAERLDELSSEIERPLYVISESDLNDSRVLRPRENKGFGHHAQWCDDFHHSLHSLLTGERIGYYADFGGMEHLAGAYAEGFVYDGRYSTFRKRRHGDSAADLPGEMFVFFSQNHDQVGNRMLGERLSSLLPFEALHAVAAAVVTAPGLPMLFMGEEWGETAPFLYFVSHGDEDLAEAVRQGRKREFEAFDWPGEPPDPMAEETFRRSRIDWSLREKPGHSGLLAFYKALIGLRKEVPALGASREGLEVDYNETARSLAVVRRRERGSAMVLLNLSEEPADVAVRAGAWRKALDSGAPEYQDTGELPERLSDGDTAAMQPYQAAVYLEEDR
jgi:maltooligosyltrehalose trehalohydrolase